jgi:hypothetical protein
MARWLELAEELSLPVSELERLGGSGIMWFFELLFIGQHDGMKVYIRYSGQTNRVHCIFEVMRSEYRFVLDIVNSRIPRTPHSTHRGFGWSVHFQL